MPNLNPEPMNLSHKISELVRFILAGSMATACNIGLLLFFTHILGLWYLPSSAAAFLLAFVVSFVLQKFWTFKDTSTEKASLQALYYFGILLINLALNTILVFVMVEKGGFPPFFAQVLASLIIACESFFLYRALFSFRGKAS